MLLSFEIHSQGEPTLIRELDEVVLTCDLREQKLAAGDIGTVVLVHGEGRGYEVKFMTLDGETIVLTAVENGGAGAVSRRSKMAAHNRAVLWAGTIGAIAPITPPFRERHRSAQRHGDLERDTA